MLLQLKDQGLQCSHRIIMPNFLQLKMTCDIPIGPKEIRSFQEFLSHPKTGGQFSSQEFYFLSYLISSICFQTFLIRGAMGLQVRANPVSRVFLYKKSYGAESCFPVCFQVFAGMLSSYCSKAAASVAEAMALKESVQNLKVIFIGFFYYSFQANQI